MAQTSTCTNCGFAFEGKYCNHCGQRKFERFDRIHIWQSIQSDLLEIDRGLLRTFVELWKRPGEMVRDYVSGKSQPYYGPLKYLLFWTALYLLSLLWMQDPTIDASGTQSSSNFGQLFVNDLTSIMKTKTNFYFFGLIPFLAIFNLSFHRKLGFNLTEILILHTYFCGQFAFVGIVFHLLTALIPTFTLFGFPVMDVAISAPYLYLFFAMQRGFFGESIAIAVGKGTMVLITGSSAYWFVLYLAWNLVR